MIPKGNDDQLMLKKKKNTQRTLGDLVPKDMTQSYITNSES